MKGVRARPYSLWGCPGIYWEGLAEVGAGRAERKSFEIMLMGPHLNARIDGLQRHSTLCRCFRVLVGPVPTVSTHKAILMMLRGGVFFSMASTNDPALLEEEHS